MFLILNRVVLENKFNVFKYTTMLRHTRQFTVQLVYSSMLHAAVKGYWANVRNSATFNCHSYFGLIGVSLNRFATFLKYQ